MTMQATPTTPTAAPVPQAAGDDTGASSAPATPGERTLSVPRLLDWLQTELLGLPRPTIGSHEYHMRCEQYVEDGRFVLRVELPGVDPDKDVEVRVADGVLTVRAERHESLKEAGHSEFFYGKSVRTFLLPHGAHEEEISATYADGLLTVIVPLPTHPQQAGRNVPVTRPAP